MRKKVFIRCISNSLIFKILFIIIGTSILSSSCATMKNYSKSVEEPIALIKNGEPLKADAFFAKNEDKTLLTFFERGCTVRMAGKLEESSSYLLKADEVVRTFEEDAKITLGKVGQGAASVLLNDRFFTYRGEDYEKIILASMLATNHYLKGKPDFARVEIQKGIEREALIAELRDKEYAEAENKAKEKGVSTKIEDIKGYPVKTFEDPAITSLKNSYQNAFSYFLAGFVFETLGERDNAIFGYRKTLELNPKSLLAKEGIAKLDERNKAASQQVTEDTKKITGKKKRSSKKAKKTSKSKKVKKIQETKNSNAPFEPQKETGDLLIIVENGFAPSKESILLPLPAGPAGIISISFPVVHSVVSPFNSVGVVIDGANKIESEQLVNIDVLAKRNLYDQMPAIITRSIIRAAVKGGIQYAAYEKGGTLVGIGVNILNIATEGADTRSWRTLPAEIRAIRHSLPVGEHKIAFVLNGVPTNEITLTVKAKEHRLIIVRVVDAGVFVIYGENDTTFLSLL